MRRREFLQSCAAAGVAPSVLALLPGCADSGIDLDGFEVNFAGTVAIVGAGASGLAAGYVLDRYGIDFEIIEASSRLGGRTLRADGFVDFPIDLGAEWIHEHPSVLATLLDDPSLDASIDVIPYSPDTMAIWSGGKLRSRNWASNYYSEYKFKRTTWFGYLEEFFASKFTDRISYDSPVVEIDTSGTGVQLTTESGRVVAADRALVTVPIKVLQDELITFVPPLAEAKADAINRVHVPPGLKVFIEFERRFYPDLLLNGPLLRSSSSDKVYYDAAFRKGSPSHVLGLFWVADSASETVELDDETIVERTIADLDTIFGGSASRHHVQHIVQNWSAEPFIRGAYSIGFDGSQDAIVRDIAAPIDGRVYFSGEALSIDNQSTVPGAMQSAYHAVRNLLAAPAGSALAPES